MKACCGMVILALFLLPPMARAEGPDDQYVGIYNLIQQADALNENGQSATAMARYRQAQTALNQFRAVYPDWNPKVVNFRLNYLASKIVALSPKSEPAVAVTNAPAVVIPPSTPAPPPPEKPPVAKPAAVANEAPANNSEEVIRGLQAEITRMAADKALLESKLKEALAARPAAVEPRQFERAQEQIRDLQKENALLTVTLGQSAKSHVAQNLAALEVSRQALLAENEKLSADNQQLQARVKQGTPADPSAAALREENAILKKQVAQLKGATGVAIGLGAADLGRKLAEAQSQLAVAESDREMLRLQNTALENRVKQLNAAAPAELTPVVAATAGAEKIRQLEAQRDELQKKLDEAMKQLAANKNGGEATARLEEADRQMAGLRARLDILEARRVPYTAEELAMVTKPTETTMLVAAVRRPAGRRSAKDLPPHAAALLADAKARMGAHELDLAEKDYLEIVKMDEKNVSALDDLASIQVDLNRATEAETNAAAALALEPNNDYSLFVMGRVRFQQGRFDEALDEFSRAAQVNPQNAELQNYLGITLSEKGLREPAEAALRKALQIDPGFAMAHANLAFVYATQQPPLLELARWHYEKAIAAGNPRNPELEKILEPAKAAGPAQ